MKKEEGNQISRLSDINKENQFVTPEGYFEDLPGIISEKCTVKGKQKIGKNFVFLPKFYLPVISGIATILVLVLLFDIKDKTESVASGSAQLSMASGEYTYLETLIDNNELDEAELVESVATDDTSRQVTPVMIDPNALQNEQLKSSKDSLVITSEDILQYLLEEETISDDPFNNL